MEKILIIGAAGQLGSELTKTLVDQYGAEAIIASDLDPEAEKKFRYCRFVPLNVMDQEGLKKLVIRENIKQIYHLAAILSASGEKNPLFAWKLNMESLLFILELAKDLKLDRIYWPSSIAVFGPHTPMKNTPQNCIMDPNTVYGISKQAGERWCEYYFLKYKVDIRSLRYPGLIGYKSMPGGGTTDYAVEIYHKALKGEPFGCFLKKDTYLPMMYMPDAIKATIDLMEAPFERVRVRSSYNLSAMSFSPEEIYENIKTYFPKFKIEYEPDFRQQIADSWPDSIDDSEARKDWNWNHEYNLDKMTQDIIKNLPFYMQNPS